MNRLLLVVLIALILGSAGFGVAQLSEIKKLQQSVADLGKERTALQKSVWDLKKRNGELESRRNRGNNNTAAAATDGEQAGEAGAPAEGRPGGPRGGPRGGPDGGPNRIANILNNPEMQQLMAAQQKAALDGRYAALFKNLKLSPADLEKFKSLLVEKQSAVMDVMAAAQAEGLNGRENRDQIRQLVKDTQADLDNTIKATIGEAGYAQYQNFESTQSQRAVVGQLEQRLSYSATPLTDAQSEQLVQILAQNTPQRDNANNGIRNAAGGFVQAFVGRGGALATMLGGSTPITNEAITQSQTILSAQQVSALQSLQQEQQASAQLMQQMRGNLEGGGRNRGGNAQGGNATTGTATPGAATTTTTTPPRPPTPGGG